MKWIGQHIWSFISRFRSDVYIENNADTSDYAKITVGDSGVTTISTNDSGGAVGHLTLKADGNVVVEIPDNTSAQEFDVLLTGQSNPMATFSGEVGEGSQFVLNEAGGASTDDKLSIRVAAAGSTTIATIDAGGTGGNLNLQADGILKFISSIQQFNTYYDFTGLTPLNSLGVDGTATGDIVSYSPGANDTLASSTLYFLHTDGTWDITDADAVATGASQLLCVGMGQSARSGVLLRGFVRIASTELLNAPGGAYGANGKPLYVATTPGHFDFTAPSGTDDFVRIVGHVLADNSTDVLLYFNPDKTWIEIA